MQTLTDDSFVAAEVNWCTEVVDLSVITRMYAILIYVVFRATLHECLSVSLRFWRSQAEGFLSYFFCVKTELSDQITQL